MLKPRLRTFLFYLVLTVCIMIVVPWIVRVAAPPEAFFVFTLLLFFVANPIWSGVIGIICGTDGKLLWPLPIASVVLFMLGISLATESTPADFWSYALVYLGISEAFFVGTLLLRRRQARKLFGS